MNDNNKDKDKDNKKHKDGRSPIDFFNIFLMILFITSVLNIFSSTFLEKSEIQIEYSKFIQLIESGNIERVAFENERYLISLKKDSDKNVVTSILQKGTDEDINLKDNTILYAGKIEDDRLLQLLEDNKVIFYKPYVKSSPGLSFIISWVLPIIIFYFLYSLFFKRTMKKMGGGSGGGGGNIFNMGKSVAKEYDVDKNVQISFDDVAGQEEAKESLVEMIDFLHNPEKYRKIGAKQPAGALLVGPPGTGKTLLAKAFAGEAKAPFYSLTGSEFVEMFVGVGASRVRDLFAEAKKNAPSIIFIDEIDAIGKSRDSQFSSNDEREQTLNQLLAEMDGFSPTTSVIVLAATNRPEVLDKALLRPGRFDRRIIVDRPDLIGREAVLKVHSKKVALDPNINLKEIALATSGATGADLANMINEAALHAVRMGRDAVMQKDLMEAVEMVIAGKEMKDRIMNPKEKRTVAYHEVGHALVSALQKDGTPVQKITIVPRTMGALGYTMNVPEEERYLLSKDEIMAQIKTLLGGRGAEIIEFGVMTTGAANDIERATSLARSMVTQYGMSDIFGPMGLESTQSKYLDGRNVSSVSEQTNTIVDDEIRKILERCQKETIELLEENTEALKRIAEYLLETENITGEEFMKLLNEVEAEKNDIEN